MEIRHLSHGSIETGGYRNELFFAQTLQHFIHNSTLKVFRQRRNFSGLNHLALQWWGFKNGNAEHTVVVVRLAMVVLLRNIFTKNHIYIALHNYDENDNKPTLLALNYFLLFNFIKLFNQRVVVFTGALFFQKLLEQKTRRKVYLFPNFFNTEMLAGFKKPFKEKQIHLGQWSDKNSPALFILAQKLTTLGYHCYFSTLNEILVKVEENYEIVFFSSYEGYLKQMAESQYTIAFPAVKEGWNRVAHESILVGTTLLGLNKGGLGELLKESNMVTVNGVDQALEIIVSAKHPTPSESFLRRYDIANAPSFLEAFPL